MLALSYREVRIVIGVKAYHWGIAGQAEKRQTGRVSSCVWQYNTG